MKKDLTILKPVEENNMDLRIKKPYLSFDRKSHTVLTDDIFTYVDFFFKSHSRSLKSKSTDKKIAQNYTFYWEQARQFYNAAKMLPAESAPLPMYYSMLNAVKAFLLYKSDDVDLTLAQLNHHGLKEWNDKLEKVISLDKIYIVRCDRGIFTLFSDKLDTEFSSKWLKREAGKKSLKELMRQLAFIHSAYIKTYNIPRNQELFIPSKPPTFCLCSDRKIYLTAQFEKEYFRSTATGIPAEIKASLPSNFKLFNDKGFDIISSDSVLKSKIKEKYCDYRKSFQYINSSKRLWYLKKQFVGSEKIVDFNSLTTIFAITHRLSEIVRYQPEKLVELLKGKENWLIHEYISLALDQFIDEIACTITGQEIMCTRCK